MHQTTRAIILKTTQFGDTSLIVTALTDQHGLQQFLVKGARSQRKKGSILATYLQPAAALQLVVNHNPQRKLHLIMEMERAINYQQIGVVVSKNAVALFVVEMVWLTIKQPEQNIAFFEFVWAYLQLLDVCDTEVTANLALYFSLQLALQLGFGLENNFSDRARLLDLERGSFVTETPAHGFYLDEKLSAVTAQLLHTQNAITLYRIKLNQQQRYQLLQQYLRFFQFHVSDFTMPKSVEVMHAVL